MPKHQWPAAIFVNAWSNVATLSLHHVDSTARGTHNDKVLRVYSRLCVTLCRVLLTGLVHFSSCRMRRCDVAKAKRTNRELDSVELSIRQLTFTCNSPSRAAPTPFSDRASAWFNQTL
jgi:hypothetical protein